MIALTTHVPNLVEVILGIVEDESVKDNVVALVTLPNEKRIAFVFRWLVQLFRQILHFADMTVIDEEGSICAEVPIEVFV